MVADSPGTIAMESRMDMCMVTSALFRQSVFAFRI